MEYIKLEITDLEELLTLKNQVKKRIIEEKLPIWLGDYPNFENLKTDIELGYARAIRIEEKIVAYATLHEAEYEYSIDTFKKENLLSFGRVMVADAFLHQKIGTWLLENLINEARNRGFAGLGILVDNCNFKAIKLYEKLGFRYEGEGVFPWATLDKYTLYFKENAMDKLNYALYANQDKKYLEFVRKLTPSCTKEIVGVRVPILRKLAKDLDIDFILECDFKTLEATLVCCYLFRKCKKEAFKFLDIILPNVCCWSISDALGQEFIYAKIDPALTLIKIKELLATNKVYFIRVALIILLRYFVKQAYLPEILQILKSVQNRDYYVDMALAWLLTEVTILDENQGLDFVNKNFDLPLKKMFIRKIKDSYQIDEATKERIVIYANTRSITD